MRAGEALFGGITDDVVDLALVVAAGGEVLAASDATRLDLFPPGDEVGVDRTIHLADLVHPEDVAILLDALRSLAPGEGARIDARLGHPGRWRWHALRLVDRREDPAVGADLITGHDITDRKRIEADLLRSEAYVTSLVSQASDAVLVLDSMVRVRFASPASTDLFGHPPDELLGCNVVDLIHPDDRQAVASLFLDAAHRAGGTVTLDFRSILPDGAERHLEAAATNLLDHPAVDGIVVNVRDLADRDRAREAAARSERRFRKLIANVSDTITLVDAEGRVMLATTATRQILGLPQGAWSGRLVAELVHPDQVERARDLQDEVRARPGEEVSGEFLLQHTDGAWVDVEVTAVNLLDDPDVRGVVLTSRNITAHKAIERALGTAHRQALDALAAKAEFVAQVGHEVRTPIHGILGLSELLAEARLDTDAHRLVDAINRSAQSLELVINDLLDASRLEAGRLELSPRPVSPHRLVADVVDMLGVQAADKGLVLEGSVAPAVPAFVNADDLRVRQVLVNLVGNAVKYTDRGSVRVTVTSERRLGQAHLLRFEVADTGVGIPADEVDGLFEPFVQASTAAGLGQPGTGLGLTITNQLVQLMGGEVEVHSEVGRGSVFAFTLPTVASAPEALASVPGRARHVARGRVLVVEDAAVNAMLLERQLERLGCEVVLAPSGPEALVLMEQVTLDLVLMDWRLPGQDGLETTRVWRAREHGRETHLPIVALTASTAERAAEQAEEAGMDGFLAKPVSLDALAAVVNRWLPTEDVPPVTEVVDDGVLANLVREVGDKAIAARVVRTYLGELDGRLATLKASLAQGDRMTLERTAHTLKSTSRALGATDLASHCEELERAVRDPETDVASQVEAVARSAVQAAEALRACLPGLEAA